MADVPGEEATSVVALIQEQPGAVAFLHGKGEADAVLDDLEARGGRNALDEGWGCVFRLGALDVASPRFHVDALGRVRGAGPCLAQVHVGRAFPGCGEEVVAQPVHAPSRAPVGGPVPATVRIRFGLVEHGACQGRRALRDVVEVRRLMERHRDAVGRVGKGEGLGMEEQARGIAAAIQRVPADGHAKGRRMDADLVGSAGARPGHPLAVDPVCRRDELRDGLRAGRAGGLAGLAVADLGHPRGDTPAAAFERLEARLRLAWAWRCSGSQAVSLENGTRLELGGQ